MQKPSIAIVGPGRAGSALGRAFHTAGYTIAAVGGRNPDNVRALADELGARACQTPSATVDLADLTILAVPDDVIGPLAADMAGGLCSAAGKAVVHLSGAQDRSPLMPLNQQGSIRIGVFHPLQTFRRGPQAVGNVAGTYFGIDADSPLREQLGQLAIEVGGHPFDLAGVDRALYHAAAVFAANYPMTLLAEAITIAAEAGLDETTARPGLTTLLAGAVNNLRDLAPPDAITGPAARGDEGTIKKHLAALKADPAAQRLYQLLAERTRLLAGKKKAEAA
ncbi:MAG TPA: DUF2520 domain-containing protein [Candidatus Angelobacter sp.]|jgi:predicted short-subunit dehydrogenase-like oxidoreductase (DUF2520 family)|nr:DUF2520 domain-containing protein [Candidatus Angelobacter sp.]